MIKTKDELSGRKLLLVLVGCAIIAAPILVGETGADAYCKRVGVAFVGVLEAGGNVIKVGITTGLNSAADWLNEKSDDLARKSGREDLVRKGSNAR